MSGVHVTVGVALLGFHAAAALYGAMAWSRGVFPAGYWNLVRLAQALVVVQAALGGVLLLDGRSLPDLHLVYGLTPIAVWFAAEQLRVVSAEVVLERRGLPDAQAMRGLPEAEQREIVVDIVRRETGVMAAAAGVVLLLAARGAGLY